MSNGHEKRQFGRRKTNLHGWISVSGRPKLPCVVRDISIGGALIELEKPSWLPFNFKLTIEATRFVSMCEVRHQGPHSVGVRFLSAVEVAALDQRRAADNRSMNDSDAWQGHADGSRMPAERPVSRHASALAQALRPRH